ncbi:MAG: GAF domain-containing protein [Anaerolineae bacterium]|jgi:GAF domain-containing protein|nr:GAF domain-containing protein [Anaerolineae bacterium]
MPLTETFSRLLRQVEALVSSSRSRDEALRSICALLEAEIPHYDWVGFYLVDPAAERELVLGPYVGAPTEHVRIPFGKGICGQAADTAAVFIVQDVSQEMNYLSCSPDVRSEIVVPILRDGEVLGELDIDSHALAPFSAQDREFLDAVCACVAAIL